MEPGIRLLLIDDDADFHETFRQHLERDFLIQSHFSGDDLFSKPNEVLHFDGIIIDLLMPRIDGLALTIEIKRQVSQPPPLFILTLDSSEERKTAAFQTRPEDFLQKDMSWDEIRFRIQNRLRAQFRQVGSLRFHFKRNAAALEGKEIPLTQSEKSILAVMLNSDSPTITRDQLMSHVWRDRHVVEHTLNSHVHNLNRKLESWEYLIRLDKAGVASLDRKGPV